MPRLARFSPEGRYGIVLGLIVVEYAILAANLGSRATSVVLAVQLVTLWLVFSITGARRARRVAGWGIVLASVPTLVGLVFGSNRASADTLTLDLVLFGVSILLYLTAPVVILRDIFEKPEVDRQTFFGAITTYLLIGLMFAMVYRFLGGLQAGAFFGASGEGTMSDDLFFSFVTLTTTGYGNLVPAANPGQSVAVVEAIVGQLFLVTAVAKIVTAWRPGRGRWPAETAAAPPTGAGQDPPS